jgi:hypothetical protein
MSNQWGKVLGRTRFVRRLLRDRCRHGGFGAVGSGWVRTMRVDPGVYVTGYDRVGWNLPIHGDVSGPYRSRIDVVWHGECCGQLRFVRGGWLSRYVFLMWGGFCARVVVFAFRDPASQEPPVGRR